MNPIPIMAGHNQAFKINTEVNLSHHQQMDTMSTWMSWIKSEKEDSYMTNAMRATHDQSRMNIG